MAQAFARPLPGRNDRYRFDVETGTIERGHDAIPEILVRLPMAGAQSAASPSAALITFSEGVATPTDVARQFTAGVTAEDLSAFGGQIALDESGRRFVRGHSEITLPMLESLAANVGAKRIWPLFRSIDAGDDAVSIELTGFAAARIVDVKREPEGAVSLTLQACIFITSTALVRIRRGGPCA